MRDALTRVGRDVRRQRHLEAHAVTVATIVVAVLSPFGDLLAADVRWSVCLAALALLVHRGTVPAERGPAGAVLADRHAFDTEPLAPRLARAREVWLFAPSGKNFLSSEHCALLRTVLSAPGAVVRCVVLDPSATEAVRIAARQLACAHSLDPLPAALAAATARLRLMRGWDVPGELAVRTLDYNPGFSLVAIDPDRDGVILVETHGVANADSSSRMHLTLTPDLDDHWYRYWRNQFAWIWAHSTEISNLLEWRPSTFDQ